MKVVALTPVKHDGKRYAAGEAISMADKQALQLIAAGVVEEPKADAKAAAAAKAKADAEAKAAADAKAKEEADAKAAAEAEAKAKAAAAGSSQQASS